MSSQIKPFITPAEYLAIERKSEQRSEYLNGEIFAMTGASRNHNLISTNIVVSLGLQLRGRPCEVYASDMRVKVTAAGLYTYPDIVVICGEPRLEDEHLDTLLNPTLLVEILSESTERYDRIAKSSYYRTLDSLAEHLLVAQDRHRVEHYLKQPDNQWILFDYHSLDSVVALRSIDCSLALSDVYEKISN